MKSQSNSKRIWETKPTATKQMKDEAGKKHWEWNVPLTLPCDEMCLVTVFQYATTNPNLPFSTPFAPPSTLMRGLRKMGLKKNVSNWQIEEWKPIQNYLQLRHPNLTAEISKKGCMTHIYFMSVCNFWFAPHRYNWWISIIECQYTFIRDWYLHLDTAMA